MNNKEQSEAGIGLSFARRMPLSWQRFKTDADGQEAGGESMRNERLLQLFLLYDDYHPDRREEEREYNNDLERVEAKLDAVIQLLGFLIRQRESNSGEHLVSVAAHFLEWDDEKQNTPATGDRLWVFLDIDPRLPQSLKMAGSVVQLTPVEADRIKVRVKLEDQGERIQEVLEKLIFRIHRREIARLRSESVI